MAHSYWRINITLAGGYAAVSSLVLRSAPGGSDLCTGGTAISSGYRLTHYTANAFDGNAGTDWCSNASTGWIGYHFAAPVDVVEYSVGGSIYPDRSPIDWQLQYSDDGVSWFSVTPWVMGEKEWVASESRTYGVYDESAFPAAYTYWRIYITLGNTTAVAIGQLEMRSSVGGNNLCVNGSPIASPSSSASYYAVNAFDGDGTDYWASDGNFPCYLGYRFLSPVSIAQYVVGTGLNGDQGPKVWTLQYYDPVQAAWRDSFSSVTGEIGWASWEARTFLNAEVSPYNRTTSETSNFSDALEIEYISNSTKTVIETTSFSDAVAVVHNAAVYAGVYEQVMLNHLSQDSGVFLKQIADSSRFISSYGTKRTAFFLIFEVAEVAATLSGKGIGKLLRDYIQFAHALQPNYKGTILATDDLLLWDEAIFARCFFYSVLDSLTSSEAVLSVFAKYLVLLEFINCIEIPAPNFRGTVSPSETLSMAESLTSAKGFIKALQETLSVLDSFNIPRAIAAMLVAEAIVLSDNANKGIGAILSEMLAQADLSGARWTGAKGLLETIWIDDSFKSSMGNLLADSISLSDNGLYLFAIACLAVDTADVNTTVSSGYTSVPECESSLTIGTALTTAAAFSGQLAEIISLIFTVKLNGDVYQCWSFTTESMFPSLYTNFQFNSFTTLPDGRVFGAKENGIYLLGGSDDAGVKIETGIRLNYFNFGTHRLKSLYYAYFGLVGENPVLKVVTEHNEHKYYLVKGMARLPQGVKAQTWELVLADIDALDFVEITPIVLSR